MTPQEATLTKKEEVLRKHKEYLFKCVATYYKDPLVLDHGKKQFVYDLEGREYLDFFGGILTISVGHGQEKINSKIKEQTDRMVHSSTLFPTEALVDAAERIAQIAPGRLNQSFFSNSGSEANEVAVLTARMHTGNYDLLALRHAYSGHSMLTKSMTGMAAWRKSQTISQGIVHAPNAYCYRCPFQLTYPSCEMACAKDIETVIQTSTSGQIAGMLAETIQGLGGVIVPPPEYFKIVVNIVREYGGLFIADEVQTGFGRTGKKWFGIEHWEVEPDMMTMAKGIANGSPVGCTVTRKEIADSYKGMTVSTFGGNPVCSVAAKATIDFIEEERLLENSHTMGAHLRAGMDALKEKYPIIGDVRGMGLMQGMELVKDRKTKEPAADVTARVLERTRENGLLIGKGGIFANVLRISPPLIIGKADVDEALKILDKSIGEAVL